MILEHRNTIRTVIGTVAMLATVSSAVADQSRLPPKPQLTNAFQSRASMPASAQEDRVVYMIAESQCDLPPPEEVATLKASCDRLEQDLFAGIDAVKEDDGQHLTYVDFWPQLQI